jgi:histone-lysine N-methyltransferase SETD1
MDLNNLVFEKRRRQKTDAFTPAAPPPKRRRGGSSGSGSKSGSKSGARRGYRRKQASDWEEEEEEAYKEEDEADASDGERPPLERLPLEVTFRIDDDCYDHTKPCACSHCLKTARTPPPPVAAQPAPAAAPAAPFSDDPTLCARCRPRRTKQEMVKPARRPKILRRKDAEKAPRGSPTADRGDAIKASAARGRAYRSERRALARHGVGDAGDPLNGGVYAETRRLRLRFARSPIHSWGVFADEPIAKGTQVLEYRGEEIGMQVGERRQEMYERNGEVDYLFRVDDQLIIDATRMGSLARFVNHGCDPNCESRIVPHAGRKKIVLYTKRDVEAGEELAYDYKFELEDDKIPCHCGAVNCRGSLN